MPDIENAYDYEQYEAAVAKFFHDEGLIHASTGTADLAAGEDSESGGEPWFSWKPCECCKSHLGGNREYLYGFDSNNEFKQFQICEDCVYYINYGMLDDQTMMRVDESKKNPMNSKNLTAALVKTARILCEDEQVNSDSKLQSMVGDPDDARSSAFVQFNPNPGTMQLPNPLSPVEGDEIFFAYLIPGAIFQAHDGSEWWIESYTAPDEIEITNRWYPRINAVVSVNDIRRSIHQWVEPVTQTIPPPPPGVDYGALNVKIVDGPQRYGNPDENTDYHKSDLTGGW